MKKIKSYRIESLKHRVYKEEKLRNRPKYLKKIIKNKIKHTLFSSPLLYYFFQNKPQNLVLKKFDFYFDNLPKNFHNYKILFASDLHLEIKPNSLDYIKKLNIPKCDLLILGGDYFDKPFYKNEDIKDLESFINSFNVDHKIGVLGNHDTFNIIENIEHNTDLNFLLNESIVIEKNNENIFITGFEDYTMFRSEYQQYAQIQQKDGFKIAVSHHPDLLIDKNIDNYNLQLSGHTHGGQIKLPFIKYSNHTKYKKCISGAWKHNSLQGFTSSGFGCSGYPLRNIDPEIVLITLKSS